MIEILTLINEIVKQIRELFGFFAPEQEATLDEIETKVRQVMLEIGRQVVEVIMFVSTDSPRGYLLFLILTPIVPMAWLINSGK